MSFTQATRKAEAVCIRNARLVSPNRMEFDVQTPGETVTVFFEADTPVRLSMETALAATLPIAMSCGSDLALPSEVDAIMLNNASKLQTTLAGWFSRLSQVTIRATAKPSEGSPAAGVGCFFSGGADSFYSAEARSADITHLIFVHGFDIDIDDEALAAEAIAQAKEAAADFGKTLLVVKTNIRRLSEGRSDWGTEYHGAALAAVAHLLCDQIGHVIVPASYYVDDLFPWGSHPSTDPLWSSSNLQVEHHGHDKTRPQKLAALVESPVAMDHLRVCWENRGGRFNCGECEKCIRTMINLRIAGGLDRCRTLPHQIDSSRLWSMRAGHGAAVFAAENLAALRASDVDDRALEQALRALMFNARWHGVYMKMKSVLRRR